jgi:hypothetical protein
MLQLQDSATGELVLAALGAVHVLKQRAGVFALLRGDPIT